MRWRGQRQSTNVEDRRGMRAGGIIGGGIGGLVLLLIVTLLGGDPREILQQTQAPGDVATATSPEDEEMRQFVSVVLASTEDAWREHFTRSGVTYREPTLVLFSGQVNSACGMAGAAVGPFYCPSDEKLYLDLAFFRDLQARLGAPGDFAQAYVVAHEVGHHVQNLLGVLEQVHSARGRMSEAQANALSVRAELQADFYAGVWANYAQKKGLLDPGDVEEALGAASAVGDDRLQQQAQGYVVPDSFTHGTSEQRASWFRRGLQTGDPRQGDTFGGMPGR
jgi:predicted metalloprotease